jgi:hypothetical protein
MNESFENFVASDFFQSLQGLDGTICLVVLGLLVLVSAISIFREYGNIKPKNWFKFFF